jgi:hypothetical protein
LVQRGFPEPSPTIWKHISSSGEMKITYMKILLPGKTIISKFSTKTEVDEKKHTTETSIGEELN